MQRRQWQPTPVLLPGKSHGWRSLVGWCLWGREESDTTERLHFHALEKEMVFPPLEEFSSLLWSTQSKALAQSINQKYMLFLELSCFFDDRTDVGSLICRCTLIISMNTSVKMVCDLPCSMIFMEGMLRIFDVICISWLVLEFGRSQ